MFDELKKATKEKDRLKSKAYATILTNFGGLNVELHGDRAPKTVYNFVQLANQGYYDDVKFHRLIPGFMVRPLLTSVTTFVEIIADKDLDTRRGSDRHGAWWQVILGRTVQR